MTANRVAPWLDDGDLQLYHGDALTILQSLPAGIAQTCVTSPPYWGLRDYGTGAWSGGDEACDHIAPPSGGPQPLNRPDDGGGQGMNYRRGNDGQFRGTCGSCGARRVDSQLGLEATPTQYVENMVRLFREVWRVLRDDGTLWVNLGDSYASGARMTDEEREAMRERGERRGYDKGNVFANYADRIDRTPLAPGLKPKDLVGIPWKVAFALQQPYYAGTIKDEHDRVWLAAMIDAEGCMYVHKRGEGLGNGQGYVRKNATYGSGMEISNCHESIVRRCAEITGRGSVSVQTEGRKQPLYRWNLRTNECREVIREVYPYLIGKQHQARIACGCPSSGERAEAAHEALKLLHQGGSTTVDFPAPASCHEPGWYLRSDIVWAKPNPMPESVTDRPTKAHEYLFLFSKQPRYFYDADAIREPNDPASVAHHDRYGGKMTDGKGVYKDRMDYGRPMNGGVGYHAAGRNRRSVWTIPTQPFPEAHFATYPEELVRPCILAGTSERGECVECGKPWVRQTEVSLASANGRTPPPNKGRIGAWQEKAANMTRDGFVPNRDKHVETTGWAPSCSCLERAIHDDPTPEQAAAATRPQLVLDPFIGSGTTSLVARKHGRRSIGIDLSAEYLAIAAKRTQQLSLLGAAR